MTDIAQDQGTRTRTFAEIQAVLEQNLPGYTRRPHQIALGAAIEQAAADELILLAQAGTGTGKSLAGLIPAIESGERTVLATPVKALQTQYIVKDLPFLQEHLGIDFKYANLKGRANYPCYAKAGDVATSGPTRGQARILARMHELNSPESAKKMEITDREDYPEVTEAEWRPFSMSSGDCPGKQHCPFGEVCISERAKALAAEADVVVTNTPFLVQDLALRLASGGNVSLLGEFSRLILDEAHNLESVVTGALEDTFRKGTFTSFSRDAAAYLEHAGRNTEPALAVDPAARDLWSVIGRLYSDFLSQNQDKKDSLPLRAQQLVHDLADPMSALLELVEETRDVLKSRRAADDRDFAIQSRLTQRGTRLADRIRSYMLDAESETVRWIEWEVQERRGEKIEQALLRSAPLRVGPFLRRALWDNRELTTLLMSATLTVGKDFSFIGKSLGLLHGETATFDAGSPFNYQKQVLLFTPDKSVPDPRKPTEAAWRTYAQAMTGHLVSSSGGGALLLFTSRRAMNEAWDVLADQFAAQGMHVMRQGDQPNGELIRVMKEDGNAVLFALRTFFEGVDVQGSALRVVIIDKLPFPVPTDVVYAARCREIEQRKGNDRASFNDLTIPMMTLILTQAFGRLIRHSDDQGMVAILDSRLNSMQYGRNIMGNLPPARRTSDPVAAGEFLASIRP